MTASHDDIERAVFQAIAALNEVADEDAQIRLERDAPLAELDSLAVTNLLVAVEEAVQEKAGTEISMTDEETLERIFSEEDSPLRSVGTLVDYVRRRVGEAVS